MGGGHGVEDSIGDEAKFANELELSREYDTEDIRLQVITLLYIICYGLRCVVAMALTSLGLRHDWKLGSNLGRIP